MNARAVDILGRIPPLDLADYNYIEICGLVVEIHNNELMIRSPHGGLVIMPVVSNVVVIKRREARHRAATRSGDAALKQ